LGEHPGDQHDLGCVPGSTGGGDAPSGGLLGEHLHSVIEGRYGELPRELDALVVALVAAEGAFAAGYYKQDQFSP
jgi:hypothetical protein